MQPRISEPSLAQPMLWIWLALLATGVVIYLLLLQWRQASPPSASAQLAYSKRLRERFGAPPKSSAARKVKTTRRKGST